ncbi:tRNA-guanine transglycosylase [Rozella allomycis CSF55]|uniref:tRNA-guanine transglycosylase n=1 Tax=Rozella allomycis (strain CSF55) TaxID=988480 RepID=A0A4P9YEG5_ROZAC|nr:tRNA-guanine transglycosylase [Rozella allomycis CSF55]
MRNIFTITSQRVSGIRTGKITLGGKTMTTPAIINATSRGAIPHVTHDLLADLAMPPARFLNMGDFLDTSKIIQEHGSVESFLGTQDILFGCLGHIKSGSNKSVEYKSMLQSHVGSRQMKITEYTELCKAVKTDICLPLYDVPPTEDIAKSRAFKSIQRTETYLKEMIGNFENVFGVVSASSKDLAQSLLEMLAKYPTLTGLAFNVPISVISQLNIPDEFKEKPLMYLKPIKGTDLKDLLNLGFDLFIVDVHKEYTEKGIAVVGNSEEEKSINLNDECHVEDAKPLVNDCKCYACEHHIRAYINHLLKTREMLGFVLLQIHNIHHLNQLLVSLINKSS